MHKTKRRLSAIVVITGVLVLGVLALATGFASADSAKEELAAADIQEVVQEIDEHVHELINGTMALHDNTEQIADNETLDEDLRADAEEVHVASHELQYIAEDILELVDELEDLGKDPAANKAEMEEAIDKIKEHLEEYTEVLEANHDLVHDILSTVPETHKVYAEATQDAMYELESTVEEIEEHIDELQRLLEDGAAEIQEAVEELQGDVSQLKRLIRKMNKPAHAIPGEIGGEIHTQFHRIEGFSSAIYDSVKALDKLAADPDKNKADMRELVVVDLWDQLGSVMWGGLAKAVDGMSDLIGQALTADPDDANALKCEDLLYEMEDVQDAISEHVSELAAKVQDPIIWEYPCMGAMNPHRLANGNTLIAEAFGDRMIEVTQDKEIVWEYTGVVYPTDSQRLENGNTLICDKGNKRVIEVTPAKEIVWEYLGGGQELTALYGVRALDNGNVLIADQGNMQDPTSRARIIEVTRDKKIVWEYGDTVMKFLCPSLGGRLENGNTLIADNTGILEGKDVHVREITPDKEVAWEYSKGLQSVYVVHGLANGNVLICNQQLDLVFEVIRGKEIVWRYGGLGHPAGVERLENGNTLIGDYGNNRVIEVGAEEVKPTLPAETAERIYGLARHLEAATSAVHADGVHVLEGAKGEYEQYEAEIQRAIDVIRGSASGIEQRRAELYAVTEGLEGEHVEAIHKETGNFKTFTDKIIAYAQQLDALKDDPVANEEQILGTAGKLHRLMHEAEGPPVRILRRANALGYEAPVSGKDIVWEYTDVRYPVVVEGLENGNTLIADTGEGRRHVIEVTPDKEIVWQYDVSTYSARRLSNGNTLIAGPFGEPASITEVSPDKEIVWQYTGDFIPGGVDRLPNGNTVISDPKYHRLFEVTPEKEIVWEYTDLIYVWSVQCLPNGNMLIIESWDPGNSTDTRLIEINHDKEIVWEFGDFDATYGYAQRLPNGNTMIADTDYTQKANPRFIEVAPDGAVVWEYTHIDLTFPVWVHRLPNGNTVIADCRLPLVAELGVK